MYPKSLDMNKEYGRARAIASGDAKEYIPKPFMKPEHTDFKKLKMEPIMENKGLTWKSVLAIIIVAIAHAVLNLFFDEQTTTKLIEVVKTILEAIGLTAAGTALWGIRRKM